MSRRSDFYKPFETHPNRVALKDLKPGDFFVIIDKDDWSRPSYSVQYDQVWKCEGTPDVSNKYRNSVFCTTVSMNREKLGYEVTCIYNWFGPDPIIINLPKKQQTIYRNFFKSVRDNKEVHELGWTDWARDVRNAKRDAEIAFEEKRRAEKKAPS